MAGFNLIGQQLPEDAITQMLQHVDDVLVQAQARLAQLETTIDALTKLVDAITVGGVHLTVGMPK
jgi:hypothetical protein